MVATRTKLAKHRQDTTVPLRQGISCWKSLSKLSYSQLPGRGIWISLLPIGDPLTQYGSRGTFFKNTRD